MPIKLLSQIKTVRSPSVTDLFSPVCWYDASDTSTVTLSGSTASTWINKGTLGTAYNLTQASASSQPTYTATQNGLKLLTFDGSDDQMLTTQVNTVTHIFVASAWSAAGASSSNYKGFLSSNSYDWHGGTGTPLVSSSYAAAWVQTQPTQSTSQLDGSNFVNITNAKWTSFSIYSINLQSGYTGGFSGTGTANGGGRQFQGDYGEIIVYQTTYLTSAQIEIITGYLANKWGSTALLPSNHPYKAQSPYLSDTYYPLIFSAKRPTPTTVTNYKVSTEQIVTDGLVLNLDAGYARSYPGSGTTWYDASGRGNNGTLINGPTYSSANGGSILFDGTNDYMSANISCSRTYYSIDWWTRPTAVSNYDQAILMNSSGSAGSYWNGFTTHTDTSGTLYIGTNTGSSATAGGIYTNGSWVNLTWTFNNGVGTLYKNGSLVGSVSLTVHSADFTLLQIGAGPSFGEGTRFDGNCGALKLYSNKVLTASEVLRNYNLLKDRYGL